MKVAPTASAEAAEARQDPTAIEERAGGSAAAADAIGTSLPEPPPVLPERASCLYQACYCEENCYLLARDLLARRWVRPDRLYVVFVSNHSKTVPLWRQRAAASPAEAVVWDYHVFLVTAAGEGQPSLVLDLDCLLDAWPCTLADYRRQALLGSPDLLPPQYHRWYRVVPAPLYLAHFTSDRSHMRQPASGEWLQPPPPWPPIVGAAWAEAGGGTCSSGGQQQHAGSTRSGDGHSPPSTLPAYLAFPSPAAAQQGAQGDAPAWLGSVLREGEFLASFGAG